ncbi:MAG: tetratricopeptide repeat protein [Candidatus Sericytochromatia bacterium]
MSVLFKTLTLGLSLCLLMGFQASGKAVTPVASDPVLLQTESQLENAQYAEAMKTLNSFLKKQPRHLNALCLRARAYREQIDITQAGWEKKYQLAEADLALAQKIAPQHSQIYVERSLLFMKKIEPNKALQEIEAAIKVNPQEARLYDLLSLYAILNSQYWAGIKALDKYVALKPQDPEAYFKRAASYYSLRRELSKPLASGDKPEQAEPWILERALNDLNQALRLNPQYLPALGERAYLYTELAQFSQALADYDQALVYLAPMDPAQVLKEFQLEKKEFLRIYHQGRISVLIQIPDYDLAKPSLAILDPLIAESNSVVKVDYLKQKGQLYFSVGEYGLSEKMWTEYIRVFNQEYGGTHAEEWAYLCYSQFWQKKWGELLKTSEKASENDWGNACLLPAAHAKLFNGDLKQAQADYAFLLGGSDPNFDSEYHFTGSVGIRFFPQPWEKGTAAKTVLAEDFAEFEKRGWAPPELAEIKKGLGLK